MEHTEDLKKIQKAQINKRYYEKNKVFVSEILKEYREKNKEKIKKLQQEYAKKNYEKIKQYQKQRRDQQRELKKAILENGEPVNTSKKYPVKISYRDCLSQLPFYQCRNLQAVYDYYTIRF